MDILKQSCYKGTVIRYGNEKRTLVNQMTDYLISLGFTEISIPSIQLAETFTDKVGKENNNLMFNFDDRKGRNLCLAPEYTAVIQKLAQTEFKFQKDVKLFYVQQCFRGERQQRGRWREFTQLGVEILNPTNPNIIEIAQLAAELITYSTNLFEVDLEAVRGLDYYKGLGFEIRGNGLQLCGGGEYEGGIGFAIGIDRLLVQ